MSDRLDAIERALAALIARMPGPLAIVVATFFYPVMGLALPVAIGASVPWLVLANVYGTGMAGLVSLGWLAARVEQSRRLHLLEWTTDMRLLTAEEFEWLTGELFRREGWRVRHVGRQDSPDGNIDLELSGSGRRVIVQCKRWASWSVGVDEIRKFGGTLLREGLKGSDGMFVTLSEFNRQAKREARDLGITLIDRRRLFSRLEHVRRTERCTICGNPMALAHSVYGWWFRCVQEGCKGKRDLGGDPARAVALLTEPPA